MRRCPMCGQELQLQRQAVPSGEPGRQSGTIKWFDLIKGYGFIESDNGGGNVYIHAQRVEPDIKILLEPGVRVWFVEAPPKPDGKRRAKSLILVSD